MPVREGGSYEIRNGERVRVVDPPKPGSGPVEPPVKPEKRTIPASDTTLAAPRNAAKE